MRTSLFGATIQVLVPNCFIPVPGLFIHIDFNEINFDDLNFSILMTLILMTSISMTSTLMTTIDEINCDEINFDDINLVKMMKSILTNQPTIAKLVLRAGKGVIQTGYMSYSSNYLTSNPNISFTKHFPFLPGIPKTGNGIIKN